jgi:hypothetical protein
MRFTVIIVIIIVVIITPTTFTIIFITAIHNMNEMNLCLYDNAMRDLKNVLVCVCLR